VPSLCPRPPGGGKNTSDLVKREKSTRGFFARAPEKSLKWKAKKSQPAVLIISPVSDPDQGRGKVKKPTFTDPAIARDEKGEGEKKKYPGGAPRHLIAAPLKGSGRGTQNFEGWRIRKKKKREGALRAANFIFSVILFRCRT